jgi:precorrin-6B methylase 2
MNYLLLSFAGLLFLVGISAVYSTIIGRICPIPSSGNVIKTIISMIKKYDVGKGDIADIGSGYGSLMFRLAKAFPERKIIGYEASIVPYVVSCIVAFAFRYKNVEIVFGDAFKNIKKRPEKLSSATAYLSSKYSNNMKAVLTDSIENIFISNTYEIADLKAVEESGVLDIFKSKLYVYKAKDS